MHLVARNTISALLCIAILVSLTSAALAQDETDSSVEDASDRESAWVDTGGTGGPSRWVYMRSVVGAAANPLGLLSDNQAEARFRLWRTDGIPFQNTFVGAGARFAVSPAFVDVGPRLTFAPIDIFDVTVQGSYTRYFSGSNGLSSYAEIGDTTDSFRSEEATDTDGANMLSVTVTPTLKLRAGPVIMVGSTSLGFLHTDEASDPTQPYVFDVYRDMTIAAGSERVTEHSGALIFEAMNGEGRPLLWLGATIRDTRVRNSGDRTTALGPLVVVRPWSRSEMPRFVAQGYTYLTDADYQGAWGGRLALVWDGNREF